MCLEKDLLINHIPEDNFLFSILGVDNDCFYEAIMEHFFEIRFVYKSWGNYIDFDFEENTNWNSFKGMNVVYFAQNHLDYLCRCGKFKEILISLLRQNYQILVPIDMHYIKSYLCDSHHSHYLYILRFNQKENFLLCRDFFQNRYMEKWIPEQEVFQAIYNYGETNFRDVRNQKDTTGLAALKKKEGFLFQFRPRIYIKRLSDMLNFDYDFESQSYGLSIFDALIETHMNHVPYWRPSTSRRFYQFIKDNLELMKHRLTYLYKTDTRFAINEYIMRCEQLQKYCGAKRNQILKYEIRCRNEMIVEKGDDVRKMTDSLKFLRDEVVSLVKEMLRLAEKGFGRKQ